MIKLRVNRHAIALRIIPRSVKFGAFGLAMWQHHAHRESGDEDFLKIMPCVVKVDYNNLELGVVLVEVEKGCRKKKSKKGGPTYIDKVISSSSLRTST